MRIEIFVSGFQNVAKLAERVNNFCSNHDVINILQSECEDGLTITVVYKEMIE